MLSEILFTKPVHKDTRSEHQFAEELTNLKSINYQSTPSFEIDFPKPKNPKQRYYYRLLNNAMVTRFNKMTENYQGAHLPFEKDHCAKSELGILERDASYLKEYFKDHRIPVYERTNPKANSDLSYIMTCYRANLAVLFKEFLNLTWDIEIDEAFYFDEFYIYWLEQDLPETPEYRTVNTPPQIQPTATQQRFIPIEGNLKNRKENNKIPDYQTMIKRTREFVKVEQTLFDNKIIDQNFNFNSEIKGNKKLLAALINQLIRKGYFQERMFPGAKEITDLHIRKFFNHRYDTNIDKEFRNLRNSQYQLTDLISKHHFIDTIS